MKPLYATGISLAAVLVISGCQAKTKEPPTQVVYRFDDHRYLELKGWDCEGELWYTDSKRGIHTRIASQFYRIFTKKYVHPSERYIAIPWWGDITGGFSVSKDYGRTWELGGASMSPGKNEPDGSNAPYYDDVVSFTGWSMTRVFCRRNTGCICHQSRLMTHVFCREGRGFNIA